MVSLGATTYWCYISAVIVQGVESLGCIFDPPWLMAGVSDSYAQFFIRVTGICLLSLTQFFWEFRHVPFQAQSGFDAQLASYSNGCARLFAKFHTLISGLLIWAMYTLGLNIPNGKYLLGMHLTWAIIMTYALLQQHRNVRSHIIDTTSLPAAAKSFAQLVKGEDDEPGTMLQMIRGEESSSKGVMEMLQDEIKTE